MAEAARGVLFLCTGNSARSILAEALLDRLGEGRFRAYSAGSRPKPAPHPVALRLLRELGYETEGLRSKSWDEFAAPGAPPIDFIFTVCDNAAGEACPIWPGHPITAHWGIEDPADATGSEDDQLRVFRKAYAELEQRIGKLLSLPLDDMEPTGLRTELESIGKTASAQR